MTAIQFIFPNLVITSTTAYNYHNASTAILPIYMGQTHPKINAYNMVIYNNTKQSVIIQPITNSMQIVSSNPTPDFNVDSSTSVASGSTAIVYASAFDANPLEMLSASIRVKTVPVSGYVYGWINLYYDY